MSVNEFLTYINDSPSPWHATLEARKLLEAAGYSKINEHETWSLEKGGKYFFEKNGTTIYRVFSLKIKVSCKRIAKDF